MPTRRAVLLGALGAGGLAIAGCSTDRHAGTIVAGSFASRHRHGAQTGWSIGYPPGHAKARLPVLIALHGRGGDHTGAFDSLHLDQHLADVAPAARSRSPSPRSTAVTTTTGIHAAPATTRPRW